MRFILFLLALFTFFKTFAQSYKIKGKVTDTEARPIAFAEIVIHELAQGTTADEQGAFEFQSLKTGNYHIHIVALGYEALQKSILLKSDTFMTFTLKPTRIQLKEIVIEDSPIKSEQNRLTYSVENLDTKNLNYSGKAIWIKSMEKIPGVNAVSSPNYIAKPMIRGFSGNRIATVDMGIQQQGQQWGSEHGIEIESEDIENISVIKGPMSLVYGSNAIGGAVKISDNIIPKKNTLKGGLSTSFSSNNNAKSISPFLNINKNNWFLKSRFTARRYEDIQLPADQIEVLPFDTIITLPENKLYNTAGKTQDYRITFGKLHKYGVSKISINNFKQQAGFFPATHGELDTDLLDDDFHNINFPFQNIRHLKIISNHVIKTGKNWLEANIGFQNNLRQEFEEPHDGEEDSLALSLNLKTYSFNTHYHILIKEKNELILGANGFIQNNISGGHEFLIPSYFQRSIGLYGIYKYETEKYTFISGGRADYSDLSVSGYGKFSSPFERVFSGFAGSIGVSYHPVEEFNVKVNLSSGFRYPNIAELTSNGAHRGAYRTEIGNKNLTTEQNIQLDGNINYHQKTFLVKFTPYFSYFPNFIYLQKTALNSTIYQYMQTSSVNFGAEFQAFYHPAKKWSISTGAAYTEQRKVQTNEWLPLTPPLQIFGEAEFDLTLKQWALHAYVRPKFVATQNKTAEFELSTPSFLVTDAGISFSRKNIQVISSVNNVFNNKYFNHLSVFRPIGIYEPARNIFIKLVIDLQKEI